MAHSTIEQRLVRCAIYTRKSTANGLDQPVNSLETQKEVCRAYIKCQQHRNWVEIPQHYDDGGFSGGSLRRPALQRLLNDIEANRVDLVVLYKIDRLSRSLTDFVRLMDLFDRYGVSFVSVTQTFDTSDSMGRLVLNILLTFAQFERELASERIRDRYEEKRRRGLYCGGTPPIGYIVKSGGRLVHDPERAETVRQLFLDYPRFTATALAARLTAQGFTSRMYQSRHGKMRGGQCFHASQIIKLMTNPVYAGYCYQRGELVRAQIEPLVSLEHWQLVQEIHETRMVPVRDPEKSFLIGILHDELGRRMRVLRTGHGRSSQERHYATVRPRSAGEAKPVMVNAARIEALAVSVLQGLLTDKAKLKDTVLSLGEYSPEIGSSIRKGNLASRRVALMQGKEIRELFLALVPRMEVRASELRMLVCCYELRRFLAWDGSGLFRKAEVRPSGADRFRLLYAPAFLLCGRARFAIPVKPYSGGGARNSALLNLLADAAEFRQLLWENRSRTVAEIAATKKMGAVHFSRIVRLNYLAPDIQAAIMDGTHPPDLTPRKILFSALPLDWAQQRHLLGFEPCEANFNA